MKKGSGIQEEKAAMKPGVIVLWPVKIDASEKIVRPLLL
jgi:hypothetical protein